MRTRAELEDIEDRTLAPYAIRSSASRGRAHPEAEHGYRTAYQRDRDRIIHCAAFRRLEYKTQVFVNTEGDYYRTRLTHTLEVSQIARTVARTLGLNADLTEALALVHDLGHAPFGHAGERALDRQLEGHGGFEHNAHAMRIVTQLERRYPAFPGLNLSYETREGMAKHGDFVGRGSAEDFEPERRSLLESDVADAADRLAYNHHDLDDGLTSGILTERQVRKVTHVDAVFAAVDEAHSGLPFRLRVNQVIVRLINQAVTDLVEETSHRLEAFGIDSVDAARGAAEPTVAFSDEGARRREELHAFLYDEFYCQWQVARSQANARRFIDTVFEHLEAAPETLPPEAAARLGDDGVHRAVCDHIAAMTDRELHAEYRAIVLP